MLQPFSNWLPFLSSCSMDGVNYCFCFRMSLILRNRTQMLSWGAWLDLQAHSARLSTSSWTEREPRCTKFPREVIRSLYHGKNEFLFFCHDEITNIMKTNISINAPKAVWRFHCNSFLEWYIGCAIQRGYYLPRFHAPRDSPVPRIPAQQSLHKVEESYTRCRSSWTYLW